MILAYILPRQKVAFASGMQCFQYKLPRNHVRPYISGTSSCFAKTQKVHLSSGDLTFRIIKAFIHHRKLFMDLMKNYILYPSSMKCSTIKVMRKC